MDIGEVARKIFKEMVLPELEQIRRDYGEIKSILEVTNRRLDDMNAQLADQSRRIDETNKRIDETNQRIDETNKRIDKTNDRIDSIHRDLIRRIDETRVELKGEIVSTRAELKGEIGRLNQRVDEVIFSIGRLYEVIVRREEHEDLKDQVKKVSRHVGL